MASGPYAAIASLATAGVIAVWAAVTSWRRLWRPASPLPLHLGGTELCAVATAGEQADPCKDMPKAIIEYPDQRIFTAIGLQDVDYTAAMVAAVSQVVGAAVGPELVSGRPSSNGKYLSVRIGPVLVQSEEQVVQVYTALRADSRTKYCL